MDGWKKIWQNREGLSDRFISQSVVSEMELYAELKRLDGFDISLEDREAYNKFLQEWETNFEKMKSLCKEKGEIISVYEVGCGSGANLFLFKNRIPEFRGGGIDYSPTLADSARKVLGKNCDIMNSDASNLDTENKYDVVMSESVFQYFPSDEYAEDILCKMIEKASKLVYLGEICDKEFEEEQMEMRRKSIPDYDEKYKGLGRRFYSREWLQTIAEKYQKKILFTQCHNEKYINSKYMFNCFIY